MNGCLGCFAFLVVLVAGIMAVQGIAWVLVNYWPPILGLSLSWASVRYINAYSGRDDE